jgi:hypothetical protein
MSTGSVQSVIVCAPSAETLSPCPAGSAPTVVQGYIVSPDSANLFDAAVGPFDYVSAASFFAPGFAFIITLYIGSRFFGMLIDMVRRS